MPSAKPLFPCYAGFFHGAYPIPNSDLLPSLLFKINENQLALEAAIMELTLCMEQRGSADVAENVRGALWAIDKNEEFIKMTLALLMAPECPLSAKSSHSVFQNLEFVKALLTSSRAPVQLQK